LGTSPVRCCYIYSEVVADTLHRFLLLHGSARHHLGVRAR
jgi:hypothetical protein